MTVCIAALAARGRAIVLVSDKALPLESGDGKPWDETDVQKLLPFGRTGWFVLFSGGVVPCSEIVRRALAMFKALPKSDQTTDKIAECFGTSIKALRDETIEAQILAPYLLTRALWAARSTDLTPLSENLVDKINDDLEHFQMGYEFLLCGFDEQGSAQIVQFDEFRGRGSLTVQGFGVIGEGRTTAADRLLWQARNRRDDLEEVLYGVFDAKAHAEHIVEAGSKWDARIVLRERSENVPSRIAQTVERVFEDLTRSPFSEKKDKRPPDWKKVIQEYCHGLVGGGKKKRSAKKKAK